MTGVFDPDWVDTRTAIKPAQRPATNGEVWSANRVLSRGDRMDAEAERLRREYEPILTTVNADRARRKLKPMVNPGYWTGPMDTRPSADNGPFDLSSMFDKRITRDQQQAAIFAEIAAIRQRDPAFLKDLPGDARSFHRDMIEREKAARAQAREVLGRSSGVGQALIGFAGGVWETMHDPVNIASMPLGGGGTTLAAKVGRSALLNGALELAQQPFVAEGRAALGEELTLTEAALNTAMGAAGGVVGDVVLPEIGKLALRGAGKAIDMTLPVDRRIALALGRADLPDASDADLAAAFAARVPRDMRTPDEMAAIHVIEREAEIRAASPFIPTVESLNAHAAKMQSSMEAIVRANTADAVPIIPPVLPRAPLRTAGGRIASDIVSFFRGKGYSEAHARGIAAGIAAEAASNHGARNPTSGAFGLGQWLGTRQAELFRRYGPNPTRQQQLEFIHWELQGGDHGGKTVLRATDEASVLSAYINDFMRPAKGVETTGDLSRGMAALGRDVAELGEADAPVMRPGELDTPVPMVARPDRIAPEIDYADVPQLRLDLFGRADEARLAQAAIDGVEDMRDIMAELQAAPSLAAMRPAATLDEARAHANAFVGAPLRNVETGLAATVSRSTLRKITSASAVRKSTSPADHALAAANVDELFARARLVESGPDLRGEPTIAAIHRYHAPMQTAKGPVDVRMTVKETTAPGSPNPLYTVETLKVEPARKAPPEGGIERAPGPDDKVLDRNAPQTGSAADIGDAPTTGNAAIAARQLELFDEPAGEGATLQADSLMHDMGARVEADPALLEGRHQLDDGTDATLADLLADIDEDAAMIATMKDCL